MRCGDTCFPCSVADFHRRFLCWFDGSVCCPFALFFERGCTYELYTRTFFFFSFSFSFLSSRLFKSALLMGFGWFGRWVVFIRSSYHRWRFPATTKACFCLFPFTFSHPSFMAFSDWPAAEVILQSIRKKEREERTRNEDGGMEGGRDGRVIGALMLCIFFLFLILFLFLARLAEMANSLACVCARACYIHREREKRQRLRGALK